MKRLTFFNVSMAVFCLFGLAVLPSDIQSRQNPSSQDLYDNAEEENLAGRLQWEPEMPPAPATGKIPENIRAKELAFASTLPAQYAHNKKGEFWQSRGPANVGGRTRAIAIDVTNENVILAAGVS